MPRTFTVVKSHKGFHLFNPSLVGTILDSPNLETLWGKIIAISDALCELERNNFNCSGRSDYMPKFDIDYCFDSIPQVERHLSRVDKFLDECRCYSADMVDWGTGPLIWVKEWIPRGSAKPIMAFSTIEKARESISEIFIQIKENGLNDDD